MQIEDRPFEDDDANLFTLREKQKAEEPAECKVLICDDCPFNIVALQSLLQQFEFTAEYCSNGKEALQLVQQRLESGQPTYKLILLDFSMP